MMRKHEVGELFEEGKTRYNEGVIFEFTQSGPILLMFFNHPTENEIASIKSGKLELAFLEKDEVIFILSKFQGMSWIDAPYTVHLSKPFTFDNMTPDQGFGLTIYLIDASSGILKAIRYVGLSNDFSGKLKATILRQKEMSFDAIAYNRRINTIYANYSTDDLVRRAETFCKIK
jgi:hypothetical protein